MTLFPEVVHVSPVWAGRGGILLSSVWVIRLVASSNPRKKKKEKANEALAGGSADCRHPERFTGIVRLYFGPFLMLIHCF